MKRKMVLWSVVLMVLLGVSVSVNADLVLFDDMENSDGGTVDGRTPDGVLGGLWDTQTDNSTQGGNESSKDGSRTLRVMSHSSGDGRGTVFSDVSNPIDEGEAGVLFFRFNVSSERDNPVGTYMGLHTLTGDNPLTNANNISQVVAGFAAYKDNTGMTDPALVPYDITTLDRSTVLKADLARDTWYNAWIFADNGTDLFDLYISEATGPAGAPGLPTAADLVGEDLAFNTATTDSLTGGIFLGTQNPAGLSGQIPLTYFDEFWWDGAEVPEPATLALLLSGAVFLRRRK